MADKYSGPYKVMERGNKAWKLKVGERVEVVSRDRLKPHLGSVAPEAAVLPTRGDCLSGSGGFCFFGGEAREACVADTRIVINPRVRMCINP